MSDYFCMSSIARSIDRRVRTERLGRASLAEEPRRQVWPLNRQAACLVDEAALLGEVIVAHLHQVDQPTAVGPAGLLGVRFLIEILAAEPPRIEAGNLSDAIAA